MLEIGFISSSLFGCALKKRRMQNDEENRLKPLKIDIFVIFGVELHMRYELRNS